MSEAERELRPYQERFQDGFVANKLLKEPKAKGGAIYTAVDPQSFYIGGARFLPTWDTTDHFHFACQRCKSVADVLAVRFYTHYDPEVKYALFFYLGCRKCGATGQRKIYLDRRANACFFHTTYDPHEVYRYSKSDEPRRVIRLRVDQNQDTDLGSPEIRQNKTARVGQPDRHCQNRLPNGSSRWTRMLRVRKALALVGLCLLRFARADALLTDDNRQLVWLEEQRSPVGNL